jgi:HAD superfamily hydrolase (TIGR01484 family)
MKKYIFFDLDNTLSRSRSVVTTEMSALLKKLSHEHEVIVVSGANTKQIAYQMGDALRGRFWSMGQNGNMCIDKRGVVLWENTMNWTQKLDVFAYAKKIIDARAFPYPDVLDLVEDRGCQVSLSIYGHKQPVPVKEAVDPTQEKRQHILKKFPFQSDDVDVKIAGTTCLDFFIKGYNKGSNVAALCKKMKWKKSGCLYIGDALFPNGNDETVIGIIPTKAVRDPRDTEDVIKMLLSK